METSPKDITVAKGHETGLQMSISWSVLSILGIYYRYTKILKIDHFKITVASAHPIHTPTGDLASYTFTGGFDKDVTTIQLYLTRQWEFYYRNLNDTEIENQAAVENTSICRIRSIIPIRRMLLGTVSPSFRLVDIRDL